MSQQWRARDVRFATANENLKAKEEQKKKKKKKKKKKREVAKAGWGVLIMHNAWGRQLPIEEKKKQLNN